MITVEMVREKGFEFVAQDVVNVSYPENEPDYQIIENRFLCVVNDKIPPWDDCDVKEFAWRDNKGEMPCDGELWVDVELRRGDVITEIASELYWLVDTMRDDDITKWRPSLKNWESEMNLDKIETQEEKEAFDGMVNSSEVPNSSEWKNGETCYVKDCSHDEIIFVGLSKNKSVAVCECVTNDRRVIMDKFWVSDLLKEKPETPEQKAERERMEVAYDLYCECVIHGSGGAIGFETFKSSQIVNITWLRIVEKTGYRKQNG